MITGVVGLMGKAMMMISNKNEKKAVIVVK